MAVVDRRAVVQGFWAAAAGFETAGRAAPAVSSAPTPAWMERVKLPPGVTLLPQIKLVVTTARLQTISSDAFHEYWLTQHAALALRIGPPLRMKRYVQNHQVPTVVADMFVGSRGWKPHGYEGSMEGWWDSEADMIEAFSTPEGRELGRQAIEGERRFSSDACIGLITREFLIFDSEGSAR